MERRSFLHLAVLGGALGAVPALAACSGGAQSPAATGGPGGPGGGTLRIAVDAAPTDSTDPGAVVGGPGAFVAIFNVYEQLAEIRGGALHLGLARTIDLAPDARSMTLRLRENARFSDGTPVTSTDALASLKHLAASPSLGAFYGDVDFRRSTTPDPHTLTLAFTRPRADFVDATLTMTSTVAKGGDFRTGAGSGPYQLTSAKSGEGWGLAPNPHHPTRPAIDTVEIRVVRDAGARSRMLASGQVDYAIGLSTTDAATLSAPRFTIVPADASSQLVYGVYLNTRTAPFSDAALRTAARQTVDRDKLVSVIFGGKGAPGNDLIGRGLPGYADALPQRTRDVAAATAAFAEAGVSTITCATAEVVPGANDSIELIRQQFAQIGVTLKIDRRDPATYYADPKAFATVPMFFGYYVNRPVANALPFSQGAAAPFNLSRFTDPRYDAAAEGLTRQRDAGDRARRYATCQRILWERGGEILWGYQEPTSAVAAAITPGPTSQSVPLLDQFRRA